MYSTQSVCVHIFNNRTVQLQSLPTDLRSLSHQNINFKRSNNHTEITRRSVRHRKLNIKQPALTVFRFRKYDTIYDIIDDIIDDSINDPIEDTTEDTIDDTIENRIFNRKQLHGDKL